MERKNVRWMKRKRWNYVERKVMETCILRAETNRREKHKLHERKNKREWLGSYERNAIKVREGKERKTAGRDARRRKKGKGGTLGKLVK